VLRRRRHDYTGPWLPSPVETDEASLPSTSGGGTTQWIGSPDGLNISGTMCSLNWRRRSWREKFSRQSGVVLLEEAREPHQCHQSIYLSLPPDKSGSVK